VKLFLSVFRLQGASASFVSAATSATFSPILLLLGGQPYTPGLNQPKYFQNILPIFSFPALLMNMCSVRLAMVAQAIREI
jgi:hypothetical protein